MRTRITTKAEMYRRYFAGEFGNRPRTWKSLQEIYDSGYTGLVSMRSLQASHPFRLYHVPVAELAARLEQIRPDHRDAGIVFSEAPDDRHRAIQGELQRLPGGLALTYSFVRKPMREAFDDDRRHAQGLTAHLLLKQHVHPPDLDWLLELLDRWEDHVIEFSAFRVPVGVVPKSRCFFWEVRLY